MQLCAGETAAGAFPVEAVQVMTKICREAESSLDYYALFKSILRDAPTPMSPLESLASSAVRTAHKVRATPPPRLRLACHLRALSASCSRQPRARVRQV